MNSNLKRIFVGRRETFKRGREISTFEERHQFWGRPHTPHCLWNITQRKTKEKSFSYFPQKRKHMRGCNLRSVSALPGFLWLPSPSETFGCFDHSTSKRRFLFLCLPLLVTWTSNCCINSESLLRLWCLQTTNSSPPPPPPDHPRHHHLTATVLPWMLIFATQPCFRLIGVISERRSTHEMPRCDEWRGWGSGRNGIPQCTRTRGIIKLLHQTKAGAKKTPTVFQYVEPGEKFKCILFCHHFRHLFISIYHPGLQRCIHMWLIIQTPLYTCKFAYFSPVFAFHNKTTQ